jgi:hypothetical protein
MNHCPQKQAYFVLEPVTNPVATFITLQTFLKILCCEALSYDPSSDNSLPAILGVSATCLQNVVILQDLHLAKEGTLGI